MRTWTDRRFNDVRKSIRKRNICNHYGWKYLSLLSLSKENLSCDREWEDRKTNSRYNGYNPSISDRRKDEKAALDVLEYA